MARSLARLLTWGAAVTDWLAAPVAPASEAENRTPTISDPAPLPVVISATVTRRPTGHHVCGICRWNWAPVDAPWCAHCTTRMIHVRDDVYNGVRSDWYPIIANGTLTTVRHDDRMRGDADATA